MSFISKQSPNLALPKERSLSIASCYFTKCKLQRSSFILEDQKYLPDVLCFKQKSNLNLTSTDLRREVNFNTLFYRCRAQFFYLAIFKKGPYVHVAVRLHLNFKIFLSYSKNL